jgi:Restriction endonuclease
MNFAASALELQRQEYARQKAAQPPRPEQLRSMPASELRGQAVRLWLALGHEMVTGPDAAELIHTRKGQKFITVCANPADLAPTGSAALRRLRDRVVANSAERGFYISVRGFTAEARHFANSAPVRLLDCDEFIAALKRRIRKASPLYKAMCRDCGDIVQHSLDSSAPKRCINGHAVPQPMARGDFEKPPKSSGQPAIAALTIAPAIIRYRDMSPKAQRRRAIKAHNYMLRRAQVANRPFRAVRIED